MGGRGMKISRGYTKQEQTQEASRALSPALFLAALLEKTCIRRLMTCIDVGKEFRVAGWQAVGGLTSRLLGLQAGEGSEETAKSIQRISRRDWTWSAASNPILAVTGTRAFTMAPPQAGTHSLLP